MAISDMTTGELIIRNKIREEEATLDQNETRMRALAETVRAGRRRLAALRHDADLLHAAKTAPEPDNSDLDELLEEEEDIFEENEPPKAKVDRDRKARNQQGQEL